MRLASRGDCRGSGRAATAGAGEPRRIAARGQRDRRGKACKHCVGGRAMQRLPGSDVVWNARLIICVGDIRLPIFVTFVHVAIGCHLSLRSKCPESGERHANDRRVCPRERIDDQCVNCSGRGLNPVVCDPISQVLDPRNELRMSGSVSGVYVSRTFDCSYSDVRGLSTRSRRWIQDAAGTNV